MFLVPFVKVCIFFQKFRKFSSNLKFLFFKGKLYAIEGWNLAMSLKKIFETTIYTGGIIICDRKHIGVMRKDKNYFAWWAVERGKNLRFITSEDFEEFLKLIIQEIGIIEEIEFSMRIITISYALKLEPDYCDTTGMHENLMPSCSLVQIHKNNDDDFDKIEDIFRPLDLLVKTNLLFASVALKDRNLIREPNVKRCYFVALLSILMKRDIIQNPTKGMIDRVIEGGENLYKNFYDPKYHSEHILKNFKCLGRIFDFRDCASSLVELKHKGIVFLFFLKFFT